MSSDQQPSDSTNLNQRVDIEFALEAAGLGVWEYDPATGIVNWDDRCRGLYGVAETSQMTYEQALQYIHPDDRALVNEAVQQALIPASGGHYDMTYRTLGVDDGLQRWVRFVGQVYFTPTGDVYRFSGVSQEVTRQIVAQQALAESEERYRQLSESLDEQVQERTKELEAVNEELAITNKELQASYEQEILVRHQLEESEARFRSVVEEAPVATCLYVGRELRIEFINEAMITIFGKGPFVLGKSLSMALPELEGQPFLQLLDDVFTSGQAYEDIGAPAQLEVDGVMGTYYFDLMFKPLRNAKGDVYAILEMATNVTQRVLAQQRIDHAQQQIFSTLERLPISLAMFVIEGPELIFRMVNPYYCQLNGRPPEDFIGKSVLEARPEHKDQPYLGWLKQVMMTGEDFVGIEMPAQVLRNNQLETVYSSFVYTPQYRPDGTISGVMGMILDVTTQVRSRQAIETSQQQLLALFEQSPVGIASIDVDQLTFRMVNPFYGHLVGRQPNQLIDKPLIEALPEIAGQGFDALLQEVIATGVPFAANEVSVDLLRQGQLETIYVDLVYQPQYQQDRITGVFVVATDVTQQVRSRQQLEESQEILQSMIELAELGQYSIDLSTDHMIKSPRIANWYGLPERTNVTSSVGAILKADQDRVSQFYNDVLQPGSKGSFQIEYTVINTHTKQRRILQTVGQARRNVAGQFTHVDGLVRDITQQREVQLALENQVQQRTLELAATNEKLTATNEDVQASNQALETAITDLIRSNQNLEQFAYIASHDLQEPLRKIQQFGDLLRNQYGDRLGDGVMYLERMQVASVRMSVLIRDLLAFSRIATTQVGLTPVSLQSIVEQLLDTLSVAIEESGAQIELGALPTVPGDPAQLSQLFQNLLANAIKFHRPAVTPRITVRASLVERHKLPASVAPTRYAEVYHRIEVADNGIGFDEKYTDRIFQVFQRLHGRGEFAGTGVGLAIVQKVVTNHGGAIKATSQPDQGATFTVYLPV